MTLRTKQDLIHDYTRPIFEGAKSYRARNERAPLKYVMLLNLTVR